MILQNLIKYYEKNSDSLPPFGFEHKEISFVILLNKEGFFVDILDKRNEMGDGEKMLVPQSVKRSGPGSYPNYLWDNLKYVFGIGDFKDIKQKEALEQKRLSFLQNTKELIPCLKEHPEIQAISFFLESNFLQSLEKHHLWQEIIKLNTYLSFSIQKTNRLVCQENSIKMAFSSFAKKTKEKPAPCLLTGDVKPIARLHPFIQGVYGAQGSGAGLISYNLPSVESFGKIQGHNAPMSQSAVFSYSTALNHLLGSSQKITFGQAMTVVFWSESNSPFEKVFADFLKTPTKESSSAFLSRCQESSDDTSSFFIHALSPHGARLSLRLSWTGPIKELKNSIKRYVQDLEITNSSNTSETFSLYSLMQCFSPCRDIKHVQPHIAGRFLFNILNNLPYPQTLLASLLEKLSDEEGLSQRRAALIKAWLNRSTFKYKISLHLDASNQKIGYLLGRLFALLEVTRKQMKKQKEAPSLFSLYKMASISPKNIFPHLLHRHSFHIKDLPITLLEYFQSLKNLLLGSIKEFPSNLSLISQGEFAVGCYQQKQELFTQIKKNNL